MRNTRASLTCSRILLPQPLPNGARTRSVWAAMEGIRILRLAISDEWSIRTLHGNSDCCKSHWVNTYRIAILICIVSLPGVLFALLWLLWLPPTTPYAIPFKSSYASDKFTASFSIMPPACSTTTTKRLPTVAQNSYTSGSTISSWTSSGWFSQAVSHPLLETQLAQRGRLTPIIVLLVSSVRKIANAFETLEKINGKKNYNGSAKKET